MSKTNTKFVEFDAEKIKLKKVYESEVMEKGFVDNVSQCDKTQTVYGDFKFPKPLKDRPYAYGSFVISIDGRIAYNESPDGTLIARTNAYDPDGGLCDYWILNLLRSVCDASLMGAMTLEREPYLTSRVYDQDLETQRIKEGLLPIPIHIVTTLDGKDLPVEHDVITLDEIPTIILTSPDGLEELKNTLKTPYEEVIYSEDMKFGKFTEGKMILATGSGSNPDIPDAMRALKKMGMDRLVVESPMYLSLLMKEKMLDELFLNTSSIFIGGDALTIAESVKSFTAEDHPHTRVLTIHSHSDFFFYTRYGILYDK